MSLVQAVLSLLLLALMVSQSEQVGMNSGPYDIDVQQVYICPDQGNKKGNFNVSLYLGKEPGPKFRKHLHKGSFTFPYNDEAMSQMEVQGLFYQRKTNDYLLMYKYEGNFCETIEKIGYSMFQDLLREIGEDPNKGCHAKPGNYSFNDFEVDFKLPTPMLEYGNYKATLIFVAEKEVFGCIEGIGLVKRKF